MTDKLFVISGDEFNETEYPKIYDPVIEQWIDDPVEDKERQRRLHFIDGYNSALTDLKSKAVVVDYTWEGAIKLCYNPDGIDDVYRHYLELDKKIGEFEGKKVRITISLLTNKEE